MQAEAAASPATFEATLALVGPAAEARARAALRRFEAAVQGLLETRLDDATVLEWTRLRTLNV